MDCCGSCSSRWDNSTARSSFLISHQQQFLGHQQTNILQQTRVAGLVKHLSSWYYTECIWYWMAFVPSPCIDRRTTDRCSSRDAFCSNAVAFSACRWCHSDVTAMKQHGKIKPNKINTEYTTSKIKQSNINIQTIRVLHCSRVSSPSLSLYLDCNATTFLSFSSALSPAFSTSSTTASIMIYRYTVLLHTEDLVSGPHVKNNKKTLTKK